MEEREVGAPAARAEPVEPRSALDDPTAGRADDPHARHATSAPCATPETSHDRTARRREQPRTSSTTRPACMRRIGSRNHGRERRRGATLPRSRATRTSTIRMNRYRGGLHVSALQIAVRIGVVACVAAACLLGAGRLDDTVAVFDYRADTNAAATFNERTYPEIEFLPGVGTWSWRTRVSGCPRTRATVVVDGPECSAAEVRPSAHLPPRPPDAERADAGRALRPGPSASTVRRQRSARVRGPLRLGARVPVRPEAIVTLRAIGGLLVFNLFILGLGAGVLWACSRLALVDGLRAAHRRRVSPRPQRADDPRDARARHRDPGGSRHHAAERRRARRRRRSSSAVVEGFTAPRSPPARLALSGNLGVRRVVRGRDRRLLRGVVPGRAPCGRRS